MLGTENDEVVLTLILFLSEREIGKSITMRSSRDKESELGGCFPRTKERENALKSIKLR